MDFVKTHNFLSDLNSLIAHEPFDYLASSGSIYIIPGITDNYPITQNSDETNIRFARRLSHSKPTVHWCDDGTDIVVFYNGKKYDLFDRLHNDSDSYTAAAAFIQVLFLANRTDLIQELYDSGLQTNPILTNITNREYLHMMSNKQSTDFWCSAIKAILTNYYEEVSEELLKEVTQDTIDPTTMASITSFLKD